LEVNVDDLEQKATWVLLLFPGVLSLGVFSQIVSLGEIAEVEVFFICVFFTVIDVGLAMILSRMALWVMPTDARQQLSRAVFAACVLIVSIVVGISSGLAAEGDVFFVALRSFPLTKALNKRSAAAPLGFLLTQNTRGQLIKEGDARPKSQKVTEAFIRVELKDGTIFEGWPEFYSATLEHAQVYLSPACIDVKNGNAYKSEKTSGPGILLFSDEIRYILFIDRAASPCYLEWYPQPVPPPPAKP
jgi:hypothetical protein